jgi:microcystin-dependent protein
MARALGALAAGALFAPWTRARDAMAEAQMENPFVGEIAMVGFDWAPQGWALCNGQLLSIAQNTALFSLLGTTYGGNGQTTFALPDLRGRFPMHQGQGPGLNSRTMGESGGEETHTLIINELPAHNHPAFGDATLGTSDQPNGLYTAKNPAGIPVYGATASAPLGPSAIGVAGGNQPHNNVPPYLVINFIIALYGIYPTRS